jgi:3'(2'), 5'-bisphosphate nucleotidase
MRTSSGRGVPRADHRLAASIAAEASELLLSLRASPDADDAASARARGDRLSHELIVRRLSTERPGDQVLSEEGSRAANDGGRTWVVDPLDGTREFGEPGREDWAVHVALVVDEAVVAGAVALPARGVVLSTGAPPTLPAPERRRPRIVVSRTRPPAFAEAFAETIGGDIVPLGSAGAKTAAVVTGEADVFVHAGGQYAWDTAAPVAIALAAGAHVSRLDGSPMRFDCADPWTPEILVCRPELRDAALAALAVLASPPGGPATGR